MRPIFLLAGLLLPALLGGLLLVRSPRSERALRLYAGLGMLLCAALGWALLCCSDGGSLKLLRFSAQLSVALRLDGTGRFFAGIFSAAFPLALLYADGFTAGRQGRGTLFGGLLCAYAAALGCCMADNLLTLILFGELLSLCAVPLLRYQKSKPMEKPLRRLLLFSAGGTLLTVTALVFLALHGAAGSFSETAGSELPETAARVFYALGFLGFGVKTALFPLHLGLVGLSDAPAPSAAVLEAVAVTNVGVLAILRLSFGCFDAGMLTGSWAQTAVCILSLVSILFAATMAVKQRQWKRKLAYSTAANLSYVLFAVSLLTPEGYAAALLHAAFHCCGKLLAFFCAGSVLQQVETTGGPGFDEMGKRMPRTFAAYTLASASLVGVPPLCGFVGKWYILNAAVSARTTLAYVGIGVLLFAALLAAVYLFTNVIRAWFPPRIPAHPSPDGVKDSTLRMLLCYVVLGAGLLLCGLFAAPLVRAAQLAAGMGG